MERKISKSQTLINEIIKHECIFDVTIASNVAHTSDVV